jgi:hypothetical protein
LVDSGDQVQGVVGWRWVRRASGRCGWSGRGGAAGGVGHLRHLAVVGVVGEVAEGFMGVLVLEGFGFALAALAGFSVGGGRSGECGVIGVKVPGRRGELVPRGRVVEQVGGVCSVCRS